MISLGVRFEPHANRRVTPPRVLHANERDVIERLVYVSGCAGSAASCQMSHLTIIEECETCHSLQLAVEEGACEGFECGTAVIASAEATDADGTPMSVMLHQEGGYLKMLEIVRVDGEASAALPMAASLRNVAPG